MNREEWLLAVCFSICVALAVQAGLVLLRPPPELPMPRVNIPPVLLFADVCSAGEGCSYTSFQECEEYVGRFVVCRDGRVVQAGWSQ